MLSQRLAVVLLAYGLVAGARSVGLSPVELTAENILARVEKTYAACDTYRDSGSVTTIFFSERGKRTVEQPFTTAFVRPDRFRYEFLDRRCEEEFDRYLVWCEGDEVRSFAEVERGFACRSAGVARMTLSATAA
jgi:hypothetical protein